MLYESHHVNHRATTDDRRERKVFEVHRSGAGIFKLKLLRLMPIREWPLQFY
jgi:hypothetical protein